MRLNTGTEKDPIWKEILSVIFKGSEVTVLYKATLGTTMVVRMEYADFTELTRYDNDSDEE